MTYALEERAEQLAEMKRQPFPRASIARLGGTMDPAESWSELIEQHIYAEIIDRYLRDFVDPGDKAPCPFCGSTISFSWGLVHGQGNCRCGWPGTLYHRVYDNREIEELICATPECGVPRGVHIAKPVRYVVQAAVHGAGEETRIELRCPITAGLESGALQFKPPLIVGFTRVLWSHPYGVHLRGRNGQ